MGWDSLAFIGDLAGGALNLGGQVIGFTGETVVGAGQAVWGAGEAVYGAGENVIEYMGTEDFERLAQLGAQGYGLYANVQKQKAAANAAQKFGGQVVVPYPVGAVGGPSPKGGFQTIVDVAAAPQPKKGELIGKDELMIIAIGISAFLLLRTL